MNNHKDTVGLLIKCQVVCPKYSQLLYTSFKGKVKL